MLNILPCAASLLLTFSAPAPAPIAPSAEPAPAVQQTPPPGGGGRGGSGGGAGPRGPAGPGAPGAPGGAGGTAAPGGGPPPSPRDSGLITINFEGGSVADFLRAIQKVDPLLNVVMEDELEIIPFPAASLRDVDPSTAIDLLNNINHRTDDMAYNTRVTTHPRHSGSGSRVYMVRVSSGSANHGQPRGPVGTPRPPSGSAGGVFGGSAPQLHLRTWSLSPFADHVPVDKLLSAVEAASTIGGGDESPAEIMFHEPTSLLFVRANTSRIELIEQVLGELQRTVHLQQQEERQKEKEAHALTSRERNQLREAEERIVHLQGVVRSMQTQQTQMRSHLREDGFYREQIKELEERNKQLQEELNALRERAGGQPSARP